MYRFSVIIPLYNKCNYIEQTIISVLNQTVQDFEIIVVDDGSIDNSCFIVEKIKDSRIQIIKQKNSGVSCARNNGIIKAKYPYIALLDADDDWKKDHLEVISRLITLYPTAGAYATSYEMNYGYKVIKPKFRGIPLGEWAGLIPNFYYSATSSHSPICMSSLVIPRYVFDQIGMFNQNDQVGEDLDLCFRIGRQYNIAYNTKISSVYNRISENNARVIQKVWYPSGYFSSLTESLADKNISVTNKQYIAYIYERKYMAYLFSLIRSGQPKQARKFLFRRKNKFCLFMKCIILAISILPTRVVEFFHKIRMKIF